MKIPATKERKFEKNLIEGQKEKYLSTNSWERYLEDAGYREKVNLIRGFLESTSGEGFVLDVGANTAGESEILAHLGHRMVPTDVNEIALSYSKIRAKKFRDEELDYYAADAHCLPFAENTFDKIVAFEVLHHMEEIRTVLSELYRVLKPGGHLFTCEPNASNPYRRLSELRDYFRGTHESSFSKRELVRLFEDAGFHIADVGQRVLPPSKWKKDHLSGVRGGLKDLNFAISRRLPRLFGSFVLVARKPGRISATGFSLQSRLVCPITKSPLSAYAGAFLSTNETGPKYSYPSHGGIPVLIREEACVWKH